MIKYLTKEDNFNEIIKNGSYLVDFYADWCGPCKMLGEVLNQIDFIDIIKVNVDEFNDLSLSFGIMSIPVLMYFKDGKEVTKSIGFQNLDSIKKMVS